LEQDLKENAIPDRGARKVRGGKQENYAESIERRKGFSTKKIKDGCQTPMTPPTRGGVKEKRGLTPPSAGCEKVRKKARGSGRSNGRGAKKK